MAADLNEAIVFDPSGAIVSRYQKMHPFGFAGEAEHYAAGKQIITFAWDRFTVCPLICYDLRFPECFARRFGATQIVCGDRQLAPRGKRIGSHCSRREPSRIRPMSRPQSDRNRSRYTYNGGSLIIDPHGHHGVTPGSKPAIIPQDLDFDALEKYRKDFPALRDLRSDLLPT